MIVISKRINEHEFLVTIEGSMGAEFILKCKDVPRYEYIDSMETITFYSKSRRGNFVYFECDIAKKEIVHTGVTSVNVKNFDITTFKTIGNFIYIRGSSEKRGKLINKYTDKEIKNYCGEVYLKTSVVNEYKIHIVEYDIDVDVLGVFVDFKIIHVINTCHIFNYKMYIFLSYLNGDPYLTIYDNKNSIMLNLRHVDLSNMRKKHKLMLGENHNYYLIDLREIMFSTIRTKLIDINNKMIIPIDIVEKVKFRNISFDFSSEMDIENYSLLKKL